MHCNCTLRAEVSVVVFLVAEHVDDVYDDLQQLGLKTLPLFQ